MCLWVDSNHQRKGFQPFALPFELHMQNSLDWIWTNDIIVNSYMLYPWATKDFLNSNIIIIFFDFYKYYLSYKQLM